MTKVQENEALKRPDAIDRLMETRAYYSSRVGKGHIMILVHHDCHSQLTASACYCSPKDEFDPKGVTELGKKGRMVAAGRMACDRKTPGTGGTYKTKVVLSGVQPNQIHLVLPYLRVALCQLHCAPGWAQKATRRSGINFIGAL